MQHNLSQNSKCLHFICLNFIQNTNFRHKKKPISRRKILVMGVVVKGGKQGYVWIESWRSEG